MYFEAYPQPASPWKVDDPAFVRNRALHRALGGTFRNPVLINEAILEQADRVLDARRVARGEQPLVRATR